MVALSATSGVEDAAYVASNNEGLVSLGAHDGSNSAADNAFTWGFACESSPWNLNTANQACEDLGKASRGGYTLTGYSANGGAFSATSVRCDGNEKFNDYTTDCYSSDNVASCTNSQAVFISCIPAFSGTAADFLRFRLSETSNATSQVAGISGYLQAKAGDLDYGPVCARGMSQQTANNVCGLIGMVSNAIVSTGQPTGGNSNYSIHSLSCDSDATSSTCEFDRTPYVCGADEAVQLTCAAPSPTPTPSTTPVRPADCMTRLSLCDCVRRGNLPMSCQRYRVAYVQFHSHLLCVAECFA